MEPNITVGFAAATQAVAYRITPLLRINSFGARTAPVLEQAWQGSDGSLRWEPVPRVEEPPAQGV